MIAEPELGVPSGEPSLHRHELFYHEDLEETRRMEIYEQLKLNIRLISKIRGYRKCAFTGNPSLSTELTQHTTQSVEKCVFAEGGKLHLYRIGLKLPELFHRNSYECAKQANINQPDNPARPKPNQQVGTEPGT